MKMAVSDHFALSNNKLMASTNSFISCTLHVDARMCHFTLKLSRRLFFWSVNLFPLGLVRVPFTSPCRWALIPCIALFIRLLMPSMLTIAFYTVEMFERRLRFSCVRIRNGWGWPLSWLASTAHLRPELSTTFTILRFLSQTSETIIVASAILVFWMWLWPWHMHRYVLILGLLRDKFIREHFEFFLNIFIQINFWY